MKINPFFLDSSFNTLLEKKRGRSAASLDANTRRVQGSDPRAGVKVATQGDDVVSPKERLAKSGGGSNISAENPQRPATGAAASVLTSLAGLALNKEASDRAAAKAASGQRVTRTTLTTKLGHSVPVGYSEQPGLHKALLHGQEASPSQRLYPSGKGGKAGQGAHVHADPPDDGTDGGTDLDVPSLSSTSSGTQDQYGRQGIPNFGQGNPQGRANKKRDQAHADKVAAGHDPKDSTKPGDSTNKPMKTVHLVTASGRSTKGLTVSPATGNLVSTRPKKSDPSHGTGARPLPNSGGKSPSDQAVKDAKERAKGLAREHKGQEAPKEKKTVAADVLADLRAKHGKP
jgi:hypothetical protein